jgi:hypothetical protein
MEAMDIHPTVIALNLSQGNDDMAFSLYESYNGKVRTRNIGKQAYYNELNHRGTSKPDTR